MEYKELYNNGRDIPDVHAKMYLILSKDGGRRTPIFAGFHPTFYRIEPQYSAHDITFYFLDRQKGMGVMGEIIDIFFYFSYPIFQRGNLFEGLNFYLKEGGRIFATGTITKILKPEMVYWHPETLLNDLKDKNLKTLEIITKTNLRREFNKLPFLFNIDFLSKNKNKTAIFDLEFTGFYDKEPFLKYLAIELFALWQEKFNLGEEKHKFYYLGNESERQVIFEFVSWNDKNYLSCRLRLQPK